METTYATRPCENLPRDARTYPPLCIFAVRLRWGGEEGRPGKQAVTNPERTDSQGPLSPQGRGCPQGRVAPRPPSQARPQSAPGRRSPAPHRGKLASDKDDYSDRFRK